MEPSSPKYQGPSHYLSFNDFVNTRKQINPMSSSIGDSSYYRKTLNQLNVTKPKTSSYREHSYTLPNETSYQSSPLDIQSTSQVGDVNDYFEYVALLKNTLSESLQETKAAKGALVALEMDYQRQQNLIKELKYNYSIIQEKTANELNISESSNAEKSKEINELMEALEKQIEDNEKLKRTNEDLMDYCKEIVAQAETQAGQIHIFKERNQLVQETQDDMKKTIEEFNLLKGIIDQKNNQIEELTNELNGKDKVFKDLSKIKDNVNDYSNQLNELYKEITIRDEIIDKQKKVLEEKNQGNKGKGNDNNDYQKKYEEELEKNNQIKKKFEEITVLVQSLIESKEKMKTSYEKTLHDLIAQKSDDHLVKENDDLRKINKMYASKMEILPQIEARFASLFAEINEMKIQNLALKKKLLENNIDPEIDEGKEYEEADVEEDNYQKEETEKSNKEVKEIDEDKAADSFTLYSIYQSSLIAFNINQRSFTTIVPQGIQEMKLDYQPKGSLTYNTFEGLFILTGSNYNKLYYYSQKKNSISPILSFKDNHQNGIMFLDDNSKCLLAISGAKTNAVECLSFDATELRYLPPLAEKRSRASCCIANKVLYLFYGYSEETNKPIMTVESYDMNALNNGNNSQWKIISLKSNNSLSGFMNHSILNLNDKELLLIGGTIPKNTPNTTIHYVDIEKESVGELNIEVPDLFSKGICTFNTHSMFRLFLKGKTLCYVNIDDANNIHMIDSALKYQLYTFSDPSA